MRRKKQPTPPPVQLDQPDMNITIKLRPDRSVEIDPQFNKLAIDHLNVLYHTAKREDYDADWSDDHKIAFFMADMIDSILAQYETPIDQEEVNASVAPVPHITESPVRDVYNLNEMGLAKPGRMRN